MSSSQYAQIIIVPGYVWLDEEQRAAVLTATGGALHAQLSKDNRTIIGGELVDAARVSPEFLKAAVGEAKVKDVPTRFVAYEPITDPNDADLVMVTVSVPVVTA